MRRGVPGRAGSRLPHGPIVAAATAGALVCLVPAPARAHMTGNLGDFYAGALHPILHLDTLLPVLALGLWSGQLGSPQTWRVPLVFVAALLAGASAGLLGVEFALGRPILRLSMLALGLSVGTRLRPPALLALAAAFVVGLAEGPPNTFDVREEIESPLLYAGGLGCGLGLLLFHIVDRTQRPQAFWVRVGVRVLGSWIAATALLVLVLDWAER